MNPKFALGLLAFLLISSVILLWKFSTLLLSISSDPSPDRVVFCDVGQGDAIIISSGNYQIVIDGGPNKDSLTRCMNEYLPWSDKQIELLVVTHLDSDHISGLEGLFLEYFVAATMIEPATKETKAFSVLRNSLLEEEKQGMVYVWPNNKDRYQPLVNLEYQVLWMGEIDSSILSPTEDMLSAKNWQKSTSKMASNERSIGLKVELNGIEFLLTGDMSSDTELAMQAQGLIDNIDVLKAGHHGSKYSSEPSFLMTAAPEHVVFSSAKNNSYGHPHSEVISRVEQLGAHIWRTDEAGDVVVQVEDGEYQVKYLP